MIDCLIDLLISNVVTVVVFVVDVDLASFNSSQGFTIAGGAAGDRVGYSVSTGDVNGDGKAEVIVGAYYADPHGRSKAGAGYVIWGTNTAGNNQDRLITGRLPDGWTDKFIDRLVD